MDEDREITRLICQATMSWDDKDPEATLACFSETPVLDINHGAKIIGSFKGRDAIMARFFQSTGARPGATRHLVTNTLIDHDPANPDTACARSYIAIYVTDDRGARLLNTGRYTDRLVREHGAWRIGHKTIDLDVA